MDNTYDNERPTRSRFYNWAVLLSLPLFFLLGWVANDAITQSQNYQAEPGVGGAPFVDEPEDVSPTPQTRPTVTEDTVSPEPTVSPTDEPLLDFDDDDDTMQDDE